MMKFEEEGGGWEGFIQRRGACLYEETVGGWSSICLEAGS